MRDSIQHIYSIQPIGHGAGHGRLCARHMQK
nr:MAG TPA: hypothetical protein [Caudoviricetes sp.]